jgi:hypothetical protein
MCDLMCQPRRERVVTDTIYLLLQLSLISVLSCADGLAVLIEHPQWFQ